MADPLASAAAAPLPVAYDDTRVRIAPDLHYASGIGVVGGTSLEVQDASDGSTYSAALDATVDPTNGAWTVGPMFRLGGVGLGLMAGTNGLTPQIGIGGMTYTPGAGVCAGFLCAGVGGMDLIAPEAMLLISGIKSLAVAVSMDREDLPALPLAVAAEIVGDLIPVRQIQDTLSTLGIPLGRGPEARRIATLEEMVGYRREIEQLLASNARTDAVARLEEALAIPQDPYVEAELGDLLDMAHFEENARGLPIGTAIEKNIRAGVDAVDEFLQKYRSWLDDGSGPAPSEAKIRAFMARALFLARKLNFTFERKEEKERIVIKIRTSTPFQMGDPELAARYAETMAAVFRAVGRTAPSGGGKTPGLAAFVRAETERRSEALLAAASGDPPDVARTLAAEARRSWHIGWIQSMGLLYEQGFFHRRLGHLRSIIEKKSEGKQREALLARMDSIAYPEMRAFRRGVAALATCTALPPDRYEKIRPAIEALRAAEEVSAIEFPDEMGDGSLLFDKERARGYTRRTEIVDAFYKYAAAMKPIIEAPGDELPEGRILRNLVAAARNRIVNAMQRHHAEVRREWWEHWTPREGSSEMGHWKEVTVRRLSDAEDEIEDFPFEALQRIRRRAADEPERAAELEPLFAAYHALSIDMLSNIRNLIERASAFRRGGFGTLRALYAQEGKDSAAMTAYSRRWRDELLPAYARLRAALTGAGLADDEDVREYFEKAEEQFGLAEGYLQKAMSDYERFNARRVGAFFLHVHMHRLGIEPITPASERASPLM